MRYFKIAVSYVAKTERLRIAKAVILAQETYEKSWDRHTYTKSYIDCVTDALSFFNLCEFWLDIITELCNEYPDSSLIWAKSVCNHSYSEQELNYSEGIFIQPLSYRLLGMSYLGFRIEQCNGHRYIFMDLKADNFPHEITSIAEIKEAIAESDTNPTQVSFKEYGSVVKALDRIDNWLHSVGLDVLMVEGHSTVDTECGESRFDTIIGKQSTV